jgi:hypothetical protein
MSTEISAADQAALAAQKALAEAQAAKDRAELAMLDKVTRLSEIEQGRTRTDANRLKSRYIAAFGLDRYTALVRDSR